MHASAGLRSGSSVAGSANDSDATPVLSFHSLLAGPSSSRILAAAFVPQAVAPSLVPADIAAMAAGIEALDRLEQRDFAGAAENEGADEDDEPLPPTVRDSGIFAKER